MNLYKLIKSDYLKHKKYGGNFITIVFFTQGFWAVFQYRIANFCYTKITFFPLNWVIKVIMLLWQKNIEILTGISIPASVKIGHSFYIGHFGGIVINANTIIGDNCNISQGVTFGVSGLKGKRGTPVLGNNIYIGANAVIVGKIKIGDNALLGANSLINSDVSNNSVMVGVPAIKISDNSSLGYI